jgi:SAM-dependent methyltransferase
MVDKTNLDKATIKHSWEDYFANLDNIKNPKEIIIDHLDKTIKNVTPKSKILDCGCGTGEYTSYLGKKGFDVTGIDYSKEAISLAEKQFNKENLKFICKSIDKKLPFKNEIFDFIFSINTLHCLQKKSRKYAIQEIKRILKNTGILFLIVFSTEDEYMPRNLMDEIEPNTFKDPWSNRIFHFYKKDELIDEFMDFKVLSYDKIYQIRKQGKQCMNLLILRKED